MPKKMTKRLKEQWARALESGEYVQGRGKLCATAKIGTASEFPEELEWCCLGVLADIAVEGEWRVQEAEVTSSTLIKEFRRKEEWILHMDGANQWDSDMLPAAVRDALGMTDDEAKFFADKNDRDKWTFETLAKYIREEYQQA